MEILKDIETNTEQEEYKVKGFDDLFEELEHANENQTITTEIKQKTNKLIPDNDSSDSELSSDSDDEPSPVEIKIKNKTYIMEGTNLYTIMSNGKKGEFQGVYSNGKIKKSIPKEIDV